jgi:hypothetical protein
VVLHLDTIRRHAHSGPILEPKTEDYRVDDTVEQREENDCIQAAIRSAVDEGYSPADIQSWVDNEEAVTLSIITEVKNTIEVRSFD